MSPYPVVTKSSSVSNRSSELQLGSEFYLTLCTGVNQEDLLETEDDFVTTGYGDISISPGTRLPRLVISSHPHREWFRSFDGWQQEEGPLHSSNSSTRREPRC